MQVVLLQKESFIESLPGKMFLGADFCLGGGGDLDVKACVGKKHPTFAEKCGFFCPWHQERVLLRSERLSL